jgi:prepilin-type N-terminal cleavage/methylation domain-containing protein
MITHTRLARFNGRSGMTLIELCVVIGILGVLFVLAVASVKRARLAANESSAIGALRTVTKAEFAYAADCGHGNYATSLVVLGSKPKGVVQGYLNEDLGSNLTATTSGYLVSVRKGTGMIDTRPDCMGNGTATGYYAVAIPIELGKTGRRAFATSQTNAVWQQFGNSAPPEPFGAPSEPVH